MEEYKPNGGVPSPASMVMSMIAILPGRRLGNCGVTFASPSVEEGSGAEPMKTGRRRGVAGIDKKE